MKNILLISITVLFCYQVNALPKRTYVDASASGGNNGTNWTNAYNNLQTAIAASTAGDTLWIANGTYKPDVSSVTVSFVINGLTLIGGFAGGETNLSQRNVLNNQTILSGDLQGNDVGLSNNFDNSYHIIDVSETGNTMTLDGLIFTGGNANGAPGYDRLGGGVALGDGTATIVKIKNCVFQYNAGANGGALWLYNTLSSPHTVTIENCLFKDNTVSINGSAIYRAFNVNVTVTNCTFVSNAVNALYNYAATGLMPIRNSILQANSGSAILSSTSASFSFDHCLFPDDPSANTAISSFTNNLVNSDAMLASDGTLQSGSPAIDAGNNAVVTTSLDLAGKARINNTTVDMGAFEYYITTGIKNQTTNSGLTCFPNPAYDIIHINVDANNEMIQAITVYNSQGQEQRNERYTGTENVLLNLQDLNEGVYLLKVYTSKRNAYLKIVKR